MGNTCTICAALVNPGSLIELRLLSVASEEKLDDGVQIVKGLVGFWGWSWAWEFGESDAEFEGSGWITRFWESRRESIGVPVTTESFWSPDVRPVGRVSVHGPDNEPASSRIPMKRPRPAEGDAGIFPFAERMM